MRFDSLNLISPLLKAVEAQGYLSATPIQAKAIPLVLSGVDVLACAQTGTGKTAAFALPILQRMEAAPKRAATQFRDVRVLVLTPTRELATQIAQSFEDYGAELSFRSAVIFGGVSQKAQERVLRQGVDILVATPGRLLDLMNQRLLNFRALEVLVLDEADRMLDMGFIHDVRRIISGLPKQRQTLFFSATMPGEIRKLSSQILNNPTRIEVTPVASTAEKIDQAVIFVEKKFKTALLIEQIREKNIERALVFTRTKRDANRVSHFLNDSGISSDAIHGNKSQSAREAALGRIKSGECRVLVATDIAARGIDIDRVTHVFNYDIPNIPESYVHRIGRTARAGQEGSSISLCMREERAFLSDIERLIRMKIPTLPLPDGLKAETALPKRAAPSGGGSLRGGGHQTRSVHPRRQNREGRASQSQQGARPAGNPPSNPNNRRNRRKREMGQGSSTGSAPVSSGSAPRITPVTGVIVR